MNPSNTKRILVVEDEPTIGDVCKRVLTRAGYEVEIASNGKVAQGMMGNKTYDLFLVDIRTPKMNGKELYRWMQKSDHPENAGRVIFSTGDMLTGDTQTFLEQSGRPFLSKPFSSEELTVIVNKALAQQEGQEGQAPA